MREGAIGRVRSLRATFSFALADLSNVRALPELDGGALMDVGCYCVSGSRLVAGEPVSVLAEQVVGPTGVDMALYGTMRFPDDVVGQFEASFLAPQRQFLEVAGDGGVLRAFAPWRVDWGGELRLERDGRTEDSSSSRRIRTGSSSRTWRTRSRATLRRSSGVRMRWDRRARSTRSTAPPSSTPPSSF